MLVTIGFIHDQVRDIHDEAKLQWIDTSGFYYIYSMVFFVIDMSFKCLVLH